MKFNLKAKDFTPYSLSISEIKRFYSNILLTTSGIYCQGVVSRT